MIKNKSAVLEALRNAAVNEAQAVIFLEKQRWGNEPACPRCGSLEVYMMMGRDGQRNKDYRWRCRGCSEMFTVRTATVFEETRLPLRVWVYALWKACSSKKGISALQLSREMEITHKSALFILRRIRHGLGELNQPKLTGTVECDEVYIGPRRPRYKGISKHGRGTLKTPVVGMVQRGGDVRFQMLERITADQLNKFIAENADLSCRIITDEFNLYNKVGRKFEGGHHVVKHSAGEYVKAGTDVHSNSIEGVFSLIRRGVMGTFHSVSKKHLPNYLNEFQFRWNTRKLDDGQRVSAAIKKIDGKRLQYRESVDNPPYLPKPAEQMEAPF
ncbi:MAG TPA: IS1595 family transposase [Terriglobales bacterium]|jgi:transposase-like protein|nr:IS1595 family transposase [Terriglobales bacterium]